MIEQCLLAAGTAPSGANLQPWRFVVISSPELKSRIRTAAEIEGREFYERRAPQEWKEALAPVGGEFVVKRRSGPETGPGSAAANHIDPTQREWGGYAGPFNRCDAGESTMHLSDIAVIVVRNNSRHGHVGP